MLPTRCTVDDPEHEVTYVTVLAEHPDVCVLEVGLTVKHAGYMVQGREVHFADASLAVHSEVCRDDDCTTAVEVSRYTAYVTLVRNCSTSREDGVDERRTTCPRDIYIGPRGKDAGDP